MRLARLGAVTVGRETDLGILWAEHARAMAYLELLKDMDAPAQAAALLDRLEYLGAEIDELNAADTSLDEAGWAAARDQIRSQLIQLGDRAALEVHDARRRSQFSAAAAGATIVALGGIGLWLALRKKR